MSQATVQFIEMVRAAAAAALVSDSYEAYCVHCRRVTVWKFVAFVIEQKVYQCRRCGCQHMTTPHQ